MYVLAHASIIRRKRRGIIPIVINGIQRRHSDFDTAYEIEALLYISKHTNRANAVLLIKLLKKYLLTYLRIILILSTPSVFGNIFKDSIFLLNSFIFEVYKLVTSKLRFCISVCSITLMPLID